MVVVEHETEGVCVETLDDGYFRWGEVLFVLVGGEWLCNSSGSRPCDGRECESEDDQDT
ncbi:MAG: hypothetical protein V5A39_12235 [Haloarculaceae archaeon]